MLCGATGQALSPFSVSGVVAGAQGKDKQLVVLQVGLCY